MLPNLSPQVLFTDAAAREGITPKTAARLYRGVRRQLAREGFSPEQTDKALTALLSSTGGYQGATSRVVNVDALLKSGDLVDVRLGAEAHGLPSLAAVSHHVVAVVTDALVQLDAKAPWLPHLLQAVRPYVDATPKRLGRMPLQVLGTSLALHRVASTWGQIELICLEGDPIDRAM